MDNEDPTAIAALVRDLALPVVADLATDLVDVEVSGQGARRVVRVVVDRDGGVDVDVMSHVSRRLSESLDADEDLIPGSYTLEVTSPGVDRPLTEPRHFTRAVGLHVHVVHGKGGESKHTEGKLATADDDELTLNVKGRMVTIAMDAIEQAKVVLPW